MSFLSPSLKLENLPMHAEMCLDHLSEEKRYNKNNIVAKWCVPINGKTYRIEFEHGTTSGRRMVWVNEKEVIRRDWMFKLVGEDCFQIDDIRCIIRVDPAPGFAYEYLLYVDGKPYEQYTEEKAKTFRTWVPMIGNRCYRVVLELDSLNVYLNDELRPETGEFVEGGTNTRFVDNENEFVIQIRASGNRREGMIYKLLVNGEFIPGADVEEFFDGEFDR